MARTRNAWLGPASRPVFVPDDVDDPAVEKATGLVQLPLNVRWSEPSLTYNLDERSDRARVYEQVLREGTAADVRYYVRVESLLELWDELVLPEYVRRPWANWFSRTRGIQLAC